MRNLQPEFEQFGHCPCLEREMKHGWSEKDQCEREHWCEARKAIMAHWVKTKTGPGLTPLSIEANKDVMDYYMEHSPLQKLKRNGTKG